MVEFPGYRVLRSIGAGATSEVFEVEFESKKRALKVFSPVVTSEPDLVRRLAEESEILGALRHPNVVSCYGSRDLSAGRFGLELEFIEGSDLRVWLRTRAEQIPFFEPKLWLLVQIARGLGAAHERGVLHRDLKPENVLVSHSGEVKITDFGLARSISRVTVTRVGLLVGSLGYMAPEVINQMKAGTPSDIFSFGVIAYEVLTGEPPFSGETPQALIQSILFGRYKPLLETATHLPEAICSVIDSCLNVDPQQRPESIWVVEAQLMTALSKTGLMMVAPALLNAKSESLNSTYSEKHQALHHRIDSLRSSTHEADRRDLFRSLAELRRLFPDDAVLQDMTLIAPAEKKKYHWGYWILLLLLVIGFVVPIAFRTSKPSEVLVAPTTPAFNEPASSHAPETKSGVQAPLTQLQSSALNTKPETRPRVTKPATTNSAAQTEILPKFGAIRFEIPEDVEIFVNSVRVPKSQRERYRVPEGKYQIRMVKDGYLPIENTVEVFGDRTALIRAGGEQ